MASQCLGWNREPLNWSVQTQYSPVEDREQLGGCRPRAISFLIRSKDSFKAEVTSLWNQGIEIRTFERCYLVTGSKRNWTETLFFPLQFRQVFTTYFYFLVTEMYFFKRINLNLLWIFFTCLNLSIIMVFEKTGLL